MLKFGMFGMPIVRLLDEAGDGGEGGGGGPGDGGTGNEGGETGEGKGGEGKPTAKEAALLKESMARKAKIAELEKALNETKTTLAKFEGIDVDQVRTLLAAQKDAETKSLESKGEWDKIKKQMVEQHTAELTTLQSKIEEISKQLSGRDATINELTIGSAFASSPFIQKELAISPRAARLEFGPHFSRDENGNVIAYDKPAGVSGRAPLVDASGNPLNFDVALQKIVDARQDAEDLKRAKTRSGSDSSTKGKDKGAGKDDDPGDGVSRINAALAAGGLKKTTLKLGEK